MDASLDQVLNQDVPFFGFELDNLEPLELSVSTLTLFFKPKCHFSVDIEALSQLVANHGDRDNLLKCIITEGETRLLESVTIKEPSRKRVAKGTYVQKKAFTNALILTYNANTDSASTKGNLITVKVFSNGSFHTTGAKSEGSATTAVQKISKVLNAVSPKAIYDQDILSDTYDVQTQLINTNFGIGKPIMLAALEQQLQAGNIIYVYDKETHPGLRVKCENGITCILFKTGSVILTGGKTPMQIYEAYKYITTLLDKCIQHIQDNEAILEKEQKELLAINGGGVKKRRGRKRKADIQTAYEDISL